ncbi:uncharacterized protein I303_103462 [Kwoniella dejecticola CBS 10117]|uniref:NmrA-like domain-containing protein n=1 Tax=Kwoniella dejecticola CBS 10117 TaxID=1296121 RepID=A0A1A6A6V9_9TREE|nr:uncharacterized protein I303_03485 [Kwoniella dejecticola CBS 10117]OBR85773.1 hypothetical protein I303_03485 [Kwoniella dejecticola CBS 10117]
MSSNQDKTIVVFSATGAQGGSVVDSLLDAGYKVVGITRNTESSSAQALKKKGVQLATGDTNDANTYKEALKGAYGVFVNVDFWSVYKATGYNADAAAKEEIRQATDAFKAAQEAGVKHVVYSTLDDKTQAPHWQSKADASKWANQNGIPITNLIITAYWENITSFSLIQAKEDGTYVLNLPLLDDTKHWGFPVADTGLWARAAFENPDKWIGKDLYAVSGEETTAEMAQILSEISGKKVDTLHLTKEYFNSEAMKKQLGDEMWHNWDLFIENRITRDVKASMQVAPRASDFKTWAKNNEGVKKLLGL